MNALRLLFWLRKQAAVVLMEKCLFLMSKSKAIIRKQISLLAAKRRLKGFKGMLHSKKRKRKRKKKLVAFLK